MKNTTFQSVWIDNNLFDIKDFNLNDIVIYSIIKGFTANEKICFATNGYFAKHIKKNNDTVRKSITKLFNKGFITITTDFDYPPSNRVLATVEKIGGTYLKTNEELLKNDRVPLVKTSNNNIINNININSSTTAEKIKSNLDLVENVCKEKNIDKEFLNNQIEIFSKHIQDTKKIHKDNNDLYSHFKYWLDKYKPKEEINSEENEKNYLWFLKLFNEISKRDYKPSAKSRELFYNQFQNNFKGNDFRKAIKNLYSSSPGNKFHIDSKFKFATPQYLLKEDNLNKYLNFKL